MTLPTPPHSAVLTIEQRISNEGMVSVNGNPDSVSDTTRKRVARVQNYTDEIRIFEIEVLVARHPILEGKNQRRTDPTHRKTLPARRLFREHRVSRSDLRRSTTPWTSS